MKVIFFSSTGRMVGGAVMCLKEILRYCLSHEIEPFVILRGHGDLEEYLNSLGIRYTIIGYHDWLRPRKDHGGIKNELKWIVKGILNVFSEYKAYRVLKREKPDVYHLNVIYNPCGAKSAHRLGIPVVWHLREFAELGDETPIFKDRDGAYRLIGRSERIVCVSDCIKEYYSQFMPADRMIRIYDGIRMPEGEPVRRRANCPMRITLSGGARVKGHRDLIEAAKILSDRGYKEFDVSIAGTFVDGSYLASLKQMVRDFGLEERVHFIGFQKDMDSLWNSTDIAVICSRFESFGLSICEAMARGIPAIGAKSTGTYEVTGQGRYARLYDVGNSEQLAEALIETIDDYDARAEYALQTAYRVRETFPIERGCEELANVFKSIISTGGITHGNVDKGQGDYA